MMEDIRNVFSPDPDVKANPSTEHNVASNEIRTKARIPVEETQSGMKAIVNRATTSAMAVIALDDDRVPLFLPNEANTLRGRWDSVQVGFVDEPRQAVEHAEALVSTTVNRLSEIFGEERKKLEEQWESGDVSTEDLRLALKKYRSFFARLLSV
jgi:hypothetical protein